MLIPPIKCQGKKTKLVSHIKELYSKLKLDNSVYYEPFMGSGIVGFNIEPERAIFSDNNPYIIKFYNSIKNNEIDLDTIRIFLEEEGKKLLESGKDYYNLVRDRFNKDGNILDFLFLNRCCFNGLMRFNRNGKFNVPYCKKDDKLSSDYIDKIIDQVKKVKELLDRHSDWQFICSDWKDIVKDAKEEDIIYCDPPYLGLFSTYYTEYDINNEKELQDFLNNICNSKWIYSSWKENKDKINEFILDLIGKYNSIDIEHRYQIGSKNEYRNKVVEILIYKN